MVIVEVYESVIAETTLPVGMPRADVGPFLKQDPVETFNLAVGLGASGLSLLHGCAGRRAGAVPQARLIARTVVGEDSIAGDAQVANQAAARDQNAAAVTACSSEWISEYTRRVRSSIAEWM